MIINIISVGKIKEKYFTQAIDNSIKELRKNNIVNNIFVNDEKCPEKLSDAEMEIVKVKEGERILLKLPSKTFVFVLAIDGKILTSKEFDNRLISLSNQNYDSISFIIGGSLGLSKEVLKRANLKISFSKMTFPHQLMKVILLDQINMCL